MFLSKWIKIFLYQPIKLTNLVVVDSISVLYFELSFKARFVGGRPAKYDSKVKK